MTAGEWDDAAGPLLSLFDELTEPGADWQASALCAQVDPEIFFPDKGGSSRDAKRVCGACPVREPCLEYALDMESRSLGRFGIWAQTSARERNAIAAGMPSASPNVLPLAAASRQREDTSPRSVRHAS